MVAYICASRTDDKHQVTWAMGSWFKYSKWPYIKCQTRGQRHSHYLNKTDKCLKTSLSEFKRTEGQWEDDKANASEIALPGINYKTVVITSWLTKPKSNHSTDFTQHPRKRLSSLQQNIWQKKFVREGWLYLIIQRVVSYATQGPTAGSLTTR